MVDFTFNDYLPPCNIYIYSKGKDGTKYFAEETHKTLKTNINVVVECFDFLGMNSES